MWKKAKAACFHSATIALHYVLIVVGAAMEQLDYIAAVLGDPSLKDQISNVVGDPKTVGKIMLGISVLTIIARLRSAARTAS